MAALISPRGGAPQTPQTLDPLASFPSQNPNSDGSIVMDPPPDGHGDSDDNHPILACRRRSRSMWLHFPHLELLFLFWAFEGAVAAQVSALKNAECPRVFWLALAALVSRALSLAGC